MHSSRIRRCSLRACVPCIRSKNTAARVSDFVCNWLIANEVILRRLFDNNYILLDDMQVLTINQKSAAGESVFLACFKILPYLDEQQWKQQIASRPKDYSFLIKYSVGYIPMDDYGSEASSPAIKAECLP